MDTNIVVIVGSLTTWEANHSGEFVRSLMIPQWPNGCIDYGETELLVDKQIQWK